MCLIALLHLCDCLIIQGANLQSPFDWHNATYSEIIGIINKLIVAKSFDDPKLM